LSARSDPENMADDFQQIAELAVFNNAHQKFVSSMGQPVILKMPDFIGGGLPIRRACTKQRYVHSRLIPSKAAFL
jgi:hypothetical protein